jgi:uncharacterized protein
MMSLLQRKKRTRRSALPEPADQIRERIAMRVQHCTDLQTFYDHVSPYLQQREAEHNMLLSHMGDLLRQPSDISAQSYMGTVETETGEIVAVAFYGGQRLILSYPAEGYEAASAMLLNDAASRTIEHALMPSALDMDVPALWLACTERRLIPDMPMRAYRLTAVIAPQSNGTMRHATPEDEFVLDWTVRFHIDTFGETEPDREALRLSNKRFNSGGPYELVLWEVNGMPVAMAATIGLSPTGMRIGMVYTPPEHRGHGYASALVAALSQSILDSGLQFATLNTDIHNPTSNKIYQAIGYVPVCDLTMYDVEPVEAEE